MKKVQGCHGHAQSGAGLRRGLWLGGAAVLLLLVGLLAPGPRQPPPGSPQAGVAAGDGVRRRAEELVAYSKTVALTLEQRNAEVEALATIAAPCGKGNSMAVRCCPCNLGKTIVGLANHLIVEERADVARVRQAVADWIRETNPAGYSGAACDRKRCDRPFREDGCGGMKEALIF